MEIAQLYKDGRERLLALAAHIDDDAAATIVPTCPLWSVKDVYAHQSGAAADILAGRLEGVASDPWTARQVAERADWTFAQVVAELAEAGAQLDPILVELGDAIDKRLVIDQWTHEQDVRGAIDRPGGRDAPVVAFAGDVMMRGFGRGWAAKGLPPARVVTGSRDWTLGDGDPVATMRVSDFELVRTLIGRRCQAQVLALWEGDGTPFVDHLVAFQHAEADIVE
jgi:uncharacterized protein (TIGR03083 family)